MTQTKEMSLKGMGYYEAVPILRNLLQTGWKLVDKKNKSLHFLSPDGEHFRLNAALYYAVTGETPHTDLPEGENLYGAMKKAGFKMNAFDRLQYLSEHENYKGRSLFLQDMKIND